MLRQRKNLIRLTLICLASLEGCAGIPRPVGLICVAHSANPPSILVAYNHCFNLATDYDDNGYLLPNAKPIDIPLVMDRHVNMDAPSFANFSAFIQKLRERYKNCKANGG